jgi:hypothetical protein
MPTYNSVLSNIPQSNIYQLSYTFDYGTNIADDLSNFNTAKTALQAKYQLFSETNNVPGQFQSNLGTYIRSAGINTQASQDSNNPLYLNVFNSWTNANVMIKSYQNLNKALADELSIFNSSSGSSIAIQSNINRLETDIIDKKKELKQSEQDLDIALSRQRSIETAPIDQSYLQGFSGRIGFTRPLKPTSVALLMGLGFFIFFVSCLILKDYFTTSADIAAQFFNLNELTDYLSSKTSKSVMIGVIASFVVYAAILYIYFYIYNK